MNVRDIRFGTIEQFREGGFDLDAVLQLSPGPLDFASTRVEFPGVQLQWNKAGAKIRSRETYRGSGVMFGFVLRSPGPFKSFGQELDFGHAVVWHPGSELEYLAPTGLTSLIVHVEGPLAELLGWSPSGGHWRRVPESFLRKLERTCRTATRWARAQTCAREEMAGQPSPDEMLWRDRILADLEAALEPWLTLSRQDEDIGAGTCSFRLVRETEALCIDGDLHWFAAVDTIAHALGVSRRTLFDAFRSCLGMGPHGFLQLAQLHELRDRLLSTSPSDATVTLLANDLGFRHLGRMSAAYREHFGEYPSDTLKRK